MTITPSKVTATVTKTGTTVLKTGVVQTISVVTVVKTASCTVPSKASTVDPTCTITPTLVTAAALETATTAAARFRRMPEARAVPLNRDERIAERKARLAEKRALNKRAPDSATITVTGMNTHSSVCYILSQY